MQAQLLADVEASRQRGRDSVLRQQLREALVGRQALRPALGAPLLLELEVANTTGRPQVRAASAAGPAAAAARAALLLDAVVVVARHPLQRCSARSPATRHLPLQVFELRNSHPEQLSHISSPEEYLALKAAGARVERATTRPGGQQAQQAGAPHQQPSFERGLMSDERLFLQASEAVVLAFRYRLLQLPGAGLQQTEAGAEAALRHSRRVDHTVRLRLCTPESDSPLSVLELEICPQPAFVSRTLRFDAAEGEPFRAAISVASSSLAEGGGGYGPAALPSLAAACGAPGAAVAVSRDAPQPEVLLRCRAGQAPGSQELCVVLYSDALQTRVLEAWRVVVQAVKVVQLTCTAGQAAKVRPCCRAPLRLPCCASGCPLRGKAKAGTGPTSLSHTPTPAGQLHVAGRQRAQAGGLLQQLPSGAAAAAAPPGAARRRHAGAGAAIPEPGAGPEAGAAARGGCDKWRAVGGRAGGGLCAAAAGHPHIRGAPRHGDTCSCWWREQPCRAALQPRARGCSCRADTPHLCNCPPAPCRRWSWPQGWLPTRR